MNHDERIRQLLGQKPDVSTEEFDLAVMPGLLYVGSVLLIGTLVHIFAL
jgi:hypothetical protein